MRLFLRLIFFFLITSCAKEAIESSIPHRDINIQIYPNDPVNFDISSPGGHVYLNGGYRGIVVYRFNNEEFRIYDRACPYDPDAQCGRVHFEQQGDVLVEDTCCTSTFQIIDGSVVSGPSPEPLKPYRYTFDGNVLRIYN